MLTPLLSIQYYEPLLWLSSLRCLQRRAIVDGLRGSILDFSTGVEGTTAKDVMDLLLLSQYFDMLRDTAGSPNCKTVFIPSSKSVGDEMRNAMMQGDAGK